MNKFVVMVSTCIWLVMPLYADNLDSGSIKYIVVEAISDQKILPDTSPDIIEKKNEIIKIVAAKNEYEPASFVVTTGSTGFESLRITVSDLYRGAKKFSSTNIELKLVIPWFQADGAWMSHRKLSKSGSVLIPELLVNDQNLVKVDRKNKRNYLRLSGEKYIEYVDITKPSHEFLNTDYRLTELPVKDSSKFQPVDVPKYSNQQIWITTFVPIDQPAGLYKGKVSIHSENKILLLEIPFEIEVLSFELLQSELEYSIYYRGKLSEKKSTISSEFKNENQLYFEFIDMKEHGVTNPTVYQRYRPKSSSGDPSSHGEAKKLLYSYFDIRKRSGIEANSLYYVGRVIGKIRSRQQYSILEKDIQSLTKIKNSFGFGDLYLYGLDEKKGEELVAQKAVWRVVRNSNARIFVAGDKNHFRLMQGNTDLLVHHGAPNENTVKGVHNFGNKIFVYADPQAGVENPLLNREKFGIQLWRLGVDGSMTYAYQSNMGFIWNDFDHEIYRDLVFAYPTTGSPVSTLAWEGYREGVDDVRYITTLKNTPVFTESCRKKKLAFIEKIKFDSGSSPSQVRTEVISMISSFYNKKNIGTSR